MKYVPKLPQDNHNVSSEDNYKSLLLRFSIITVITLTVLAGAIAITDCLAILLPKSLEVYLGDLSTGKGKCAGNDTVEGKKLLAIFEKVKDAAEIDKKSHLSLCFVEGEVKNAFAALGGRISFHQGLLKEMIDERELAYVLAHEIGHQEMRHHVRGISKLIVMSLVSGVVSGQGEAQKIGQEFIRSGLYYFSREHEQEADEYALKLVKKMYGTSEPVYSAIRKFDALSSRPKWTSFFSTHPHPDDRIKYLKKLDKVPVDL